MPWKSRTDWGPSEFLHADDVNNIGLDLRTWGGNVNGGGYTLSNVVLAGVSTASVAGVSSFNTRIGDVLPIAADYSTFYVPLARQVIAGSGLTGGGVLSGDVTLTAPTMGASGTLHKAGIVPDPGATSGAVRFLREDASWAIPTGTGAGMADPTTAKGDLIVRGNTAPPTNLAVGTNGQVLTVDLSTAVGVKWATPVTGGMADPTLAKGDLIVRGSAAPPTNLAVGANGQVLTADSTSGVGVKWAAPAVMGASGSSHAAGVAPDPGATAGSTRFLREDATWAVPAGTGGGSQTPWASDIDAAAHSLNNANNVVGQQIIASNYIQAQSIYALSTITTGSQASDFMGTSAFSLVWYSPIAKSRWQFVKSGSESTGNVGSDLYVQRFADDGSFLSNFLTFVRASGRLGIQNAGPAYTLDVGGDINSTGAHRIGGVALLTGTTLINVTQVGIGTATPAAPLDLNAGSLGSAANATLQLARLGFLSGNADVLVLSAMRSAAGGTDWSTATTRLQKIIDTTKAGYIDWDAAGGAMAGSMALGNNVSEWLRIEATTGRVGIGVVSPGYKLDVAGDVNISSGSSFRINGVAISTTGAYVGPTTFSNSGKAANVVYRNTSGFPRFVSITFYFPNTGIGYSGIAYCDTNAAPTTEVAQVSVTSNSSTTYMSLSFVVLNNYYYKITMSGTSVVIQDWAEWT